MATPMTTPREYEEHRRNRYYDLFLHYSIVRMTIIAFLLPLGGVIVATDGNKEWVAGIALLFLGWVMNLVFGALALRLNLRYSFLDKWLRSHAGPIVPRYEEKIPGNSFCHYVRVCVFRSPIAQSENGEEWKWIEPIIQYPILLGIAGFLVLVYLF